MQIVSTQKNIVISPTKVRPVVREIKNMTPSDALEVLPLVNKRGASYLEKVIKSAIANAKSKGVNPSDLIFKEIQVNEGPRLKRGRPVSRGMWHPFVKKMSHIRVVLETKTVNVVEGKKKQSPKQVRTSHSAKSARDDKADMASLSALSKGKPKKTGLDKVKQKKKGVKASA